MIKKLINISIFLFIFSLYFVSFLMIYDNFRERKLKNLESNALDYFDNIDNASIMHQIVLIDTNDAKDLNVRKIALFLINGEIEENAIPSLTYGIGEGRVFQIHYNEANGGE